MTEKIEHIKNQILKLHKAWDAIPDDDDSLDGLKDAESIESDVQNLILDYCRKKQYHVDDLTIEKLNTLNEADDLFPYERNEKFLEQLTLKHDDVAELMWFYHHTFWMEGEMWKG